MSFFKNKLAVAVIVLSIIFLSLIGCSIKRDKVSKLESGAGSTFNFVQAGIYKTNKNIKDFIGFIANFSDVKRENEELRKENNELQNKASSYDYIKKENEKLREMLDYKNRNSEYQYMGCDITGRSGDGWLDGFIINRGYKDGVANGMVVITPQGLVGQVTSTADIWSKVQTLANENIAVVCTDKDTKGNTGVVKGYKDSNNRVLAKLYDLPIDSNIKKGDVILTSGLGGVYPKNIKIGSVIDIEEDKGKIRKNAIIKPYVDLNKLEEVYIVIPKDLNEIKY